MKVGSLQLAALQIYVFDPAHEEEPFPGSLEGRTLRVTDRNAAADHLLEASNSAGEDGDRPLENALVALARRVRRA